MIVAGNHPEAFPELDRLIELGLERGFVSTTEVTEALADAGLDASGVEDAMRDLEAQGGELREAPLLTDEGKGTIDRMTVEGTTDALERFLQEIGRYPLLTKVEEI